MHALSKEDKEKHLFLLDFCIFSIGWLHIHQLVMYRQTSEFCEKKLSWFFVKIKFLPLLTPGTYKRGEKKKIVNKPCSQLRNRNDLEPKGQVCHNNYNFTSSTKINIYHLFLYCFYNSHYLSDTNLKKKKVNK